MESVSKSRLKLIILLTVVFAATVCRAQQITFTGNAEVFMPGLVSTKNADVKITFSPDGKKMLWGGIDWIAGKKDNDIWQSDKVNGKWTKPERVSFDTDSDDFDPFFLPDGRGVYFFSNRPGGFGGDDIYFVPYNKTTNTFGEAMNLGSGINTAGNEWAPITDASGKYLIFSSDGHGGLGGEDLFKAEILPSGYGKPENLGSNINGPDDDFDAAVLPNDALVFTSCRNKDKKAELYIAYKKNGTFTTPEKLPVQINGSEFWTFAPSVNFREPGCLYFCSHLKPNIGRTDVYRVRYKMK